MICTTAAPPDEVLALAWIIHRKLYYRGARLLLVRTDKGILVHTVNKPELIDMHACSGVQSKQVLPNLE